MKTRSLLFNLSLIISIGCFTAGYFLAGYWLILPLLIVLAAAWIFAYQRPTFWLSAVSLVGAVILAAVGIVLDLSPVLMVIACTMALVSWELIHFKHNTTKNTPAAHRSDLEKHHLRSLVSAASAGLTLALLTMLVNLQLPFGIVALLVLIAMGSLVYGMQLITKKKI
jgi:hypothetical protein